MNAIMTLFPYKLHGIWVFDDKTKGLEREAFVSGMTEIIDALVKDTLKSNVDDGFVLHFSASPFPGFKYKLSRTREEHGGNWYTCDTNGMEGWLCPALFKYYDNAPDAIYVQALYSEEDDLEIINDINTYEPKGFWSLVRSFISLFIPISI